MPVRTPGADPKHFVFVWQTSRSVAEVARRLRMAPKAVYMRAARYREKGVELHAFPDGHQRVDVAALNAVVQAIRGRA